MPSTAQSPRLLLDGWKDSKSMQDWHLRHAAMHAQLARQMAAKAVIGVEQNLFYTTGYSPVTSQTSDVPLNATLGSLPNRALITNIYVLATGATQVNAGAQTLNIWTGAGKTGTRLDAGAVSCGTLNSLAQWQWCEAGGALINDIIGGANSGVSTNVNTAFVSFAAAGITGPGTYDVFVQGLVLPFGP